MNRKRLIMIFSAFIVVVTVTIVFVAIRRNLLIKEYVRFTGVSESQAKRLTTSELSGIVKQLRTIN